MNENPIELTMVPEQTASDMLKISQDTLIDERNYMQDVFQSPEALAGLMQKSRLQGDPHDATNSEILARLNALELRLEARLDRLERLVKAALDTRLYDQS